MSCEFETRVSLLLDEALSPTEAAEVGRHVAECESCRLLAEDFAHLGRTIQTLELPGEASCEDALAAVLSSRGGQFWQRRIAVPLPLAAAATLLLALLGAWTAYGELAGPGRDPWMAGGTQATPAATETTSLDRFDRGERAVLYKVRRDVP